MLASCRSRPMHPVSPVSVSGPCASKQVRLGRRVVHGAVGLNHGIHAQFRRLDAARCHDMPKFVTLTQAEYDALKTLKKLDENTYYSIFEE